MPKKKKKAYMGWFFRKREKICIVKMDFKVWNTKINV